MNVTVPCGIVLTKRLARRSLSYRGCFRTFVRRGPEVLFTYIIIIMTIIYPDKICQDKTVKA